MFLLLGINPSLTYASHNQAQDQQKNQINRDDSKPSSEIVPIPPPTNPDIQPIPKPDGNPVIQQAAWWNPLDWFDISIVNAVKTALSVSMNFLVEAFIGVPFDIVSINEKLSAYENGIDDPRQIPNPGVFDYASLITTAALDLNIPISSSQYFASINPFAQTQVQAQEGAQGLAESGVVLEIWLRVRNVAYALSAVIMIIIGFMIMVRWRLDPRTVVTIQNSLPRIVIALILVTFSFAIAGLMIDLTRFVTDVIMSLVDVPGGKIFDFAINLIAVIVLLFFVPGVGQTAGVVGLIIALIIVLIVAYIFAVLIFKLLSRYVIFLILTIFAPFFFLAGALPGGEGLILNWFRRQAAALMAIPMTALFVNLSFKIGFGGSLTDGFPSPWPLIGPLSSMLGGLLLFPFVGLGLFFFATKVPDIVDELFGIKEMGARKGIGPGAILGAPLAAASTVGTATRAAPMVTGSLEGWAARGGAGSIGNRLRGGIAGALYSAARPFDRQSKPLSVDELRTDYRKSSEKDKEASFSTWNQKREAEERAAQQKVSSGPKGTVATGDTGFGTDREDQQ